MIRHHHETVSQPAAVTKSCVLSVVHLRYLRCTRYCGGHLKRNGDAEAVKYMSARGRSCVRAGEGPYSFITNQEEIGQINTSSRLDHLRCAFLTKAAVPEKPHARLRFAGSKSMFRRHRFQSQSNDGMSQSLTPGLGNTPQAQTAVADASTVLGKGMQAHWES